MGLKIKRDEPVSTGVKRVLQEQCHKSLNYLSRENDVHESIHEVRKSFKKIRSAHRLIRDYSDFYKEENKFFRDEARKISELRDATSVLEILNYLLFLYEDEIYQNTFNAVKESLVKLREQLTIRSFSEGNPLTEIKLKLEKKCRETAELEIDVKDFSQIRPSIHRVYKRGYKAFKKAKESTDADDYHEWRKRAKYLRYQVKMLKEIWKPIYSELEDELHDLTDYLGDDHDLHLLSRVIKEEEVKFQSNSEKSLLQALITENQKKFREKALQVGKKIYALSPDEFVNQMEESWKASDMKM